VGRRELRASDAGVRASSGRMPHFRHPDASRPDYIILQFNTNPIGFMVYRLFYNATYDHVHPAYNPYFSACFFSRNSVFLSQQISQQCFSAGLSAQPNGALL
jgi:hypothetical protein